MKTKKMSLANIQGKLSRTEMKNIMAGSGSNRACTTTTQCQVWYGMNCGCMSDHICGCIVA